MGDWVPRNWVPNECQVPTYSQTGLSVMWDCSVAWDWVPCGIECWFLSLGTPNKWCWTCVALALSLPSIQLPWHSVNQSLATRSVVLWIFLFIHDIFVYSLYFDNLICLSHLKRTKKQFVSFIHCYANSYFMFNKNLNC